MQLRYGPLFIYIYNMMLPSMSIVWETYGAVSRRVMPNRRDRHSPWNHIIFFFLRRNVIITHHFAPFRIESTVINIDYRFQSFWIMSSVKYDLVRYGHHDISDVNICYSRANRVCRVRIVRKRRTKPRRTTSQYPPPSRDRLECIWFFSNSFSRRSPVRFDSGSVRGYRFLRFDVKTKPLNCI